VKSFIRKHAAQIKGVLECFDRVIIRGHLPMAGLGYFSTWLYSKKISLNLQNLPEGWRRFKDIGPQFAEWLKEHARGLAEGAGRPYVHLPTAQRMEQQARGMIETEGLKEGLVCIYSTMETCRTFRVTFGEGRPALKTDLRRCLVLYYYWLDRDFGLIHVKVQTWCPFTVQVYVNGHEWLARKLEREGIAFTKVDNAFVDVADPARAQACARRFWRRDWLKLLDALAQQVNPLLDDWVAGQGYYWVLDQVEFSTDVLFADKSTLAGLRGRLYEHAALCFGAEQVMTFLGRKYRGTFQGELKTHWHRREAGAAVKHWMKRNAIKMYDKDGRVLRIETVINNPREFRVHRARHKQDGSTEVGWFAMSKGVTNLYRYADVSRQANARYLEALVVVDDLSVGQRQLERRCAPVAYQGRQRRALQPLGRDDQALFQAVLRGEHTVRGFRNRELAAHLFGARPSDAAERRRQCGRISRLISLLRAHGLVAKVPRSRRYYVTTMGGRFMSTVIQVRHKLIPAKLSQAA
jgi:hypothetical protein